MENILKGYRFYPWQIKALQSICKKGKCNASQVMRRAMSLYILKKPLKPMTKEQEDILHFKARSIFETRK